MLPRIWKEGKKMLFGALLLCSAYILYLIALEQNPSKTQSSFQRAFLKIEKEFDAFSEGLNKVITNETNLDKLWDKENFFSSKFGIVVFKDNQPVFWNSTIFPLHHFNPELFNPDKKVVRLPNGFYLIKKTPLNQSSILLYFKLQESYPYTNSYLFESTSKYLPTRHKAKIHGEEGLPIFSAKNQEDPVFYISPELSFSPSKEIEVIILFVFLMGIYYTLSGGAVFLKNQQKSQATISISLIFIFSFLVICIFKQPNFIHSLQIFDPEIYASSTLFPSFGILIVNSFFLGVLILWFIKFIDQYQKLQQNALFLIGVYLLLLPFAFYLSWAIQSFILNSSVSLEIDEIFDLSIYSFLFLFVLGALFYTYVSLALQTVFYLKKVISRYNQLVFIWFFGGVIYFLVVLVYTDFNLVSALFPLVINGVLFLMKKTKNSISLKFKEGTIILSIVSVYAALSISENTYINERQNREVYASQLVTELNPVLELEFLKLQENIFDYVASFPSDTFNQPQEFHSALTDNNFSTYWDSYDLRFFLFDEQQKPMLDFLPGEAKSYQQLNDIIQQHATIAELSSELYIVTDYFDQLSYISKLELLFSDGLSAWLFIEFRSKKIPEEIGLPRLLINESANVLDNLEGYSIARYVHDQLVMRFGEYNFPLNFKSFKINKTNEDSYNHFTLHSDGNHVIVISKKEKTFFQRWTSFSYLFLFFGVLYFMLRVSKKYTQKKSTVNLLLSTKIQLVLVSTVMGSFIIFSYVTGQFVKNQHEEVTYEHLRERLQSVEIEVKQKIGDQTEIDIETQRSYMLYLMKKFASVFATDINLYALDGELIASSQPTLYDKGISGTQMNAKAFRGLAHASKSEFIHREQIGGLSYLSAYRPFKNMKGEVLAFLNLQHFSKQSAYESQISTFLVSIINLAVLLLVLTVIISIFISNSIIAPLRQLQTSLKFIELGKENKPIDYKGVDEIGALVKQYNDKLAELELKALQLARSERETAWREMAKQVAHEIKNPLTPMKLSLQHFQRAFDPSASDAPDKIQHLTNSLIEQINALTHIANEFSNFAKMPKANEEKLELISLLKSCIYLFENSSLSISFLSSVENAYIFADKDLMLRVFNNVLKNAIQAIPDERTPTITVHIFEEQNNYQVDVTDNGVGISKEQKHKIFIPNFTTKSKGSGIGLAMVKQIVENHQGSIWFTSKEEIGTTFHIQLPKYQEK